MVTHKRGDAWSGDDASFTLVTDGVKSVVAADSVE
jgi:hypothetical protein